MTPSVPSGVQTLRDLADQLEADSERQQALLASLAILFGSLPSDPTLWPVESKLRAVYEAYVRCRDAAGERGAEL